MSSVLHVALRTGMMPILNSMATTGIVALPGMMTGQILAGIDPVEAAKYQVLIMFLIASATALGSFFGGARRRAAADGQPPSPAARPHSRRAELRRLGSRHAAVSVRSPIVPALPLVGAGLGSSGGTKAPRPAALAATAAAAASLAAAAAVSAAAAALSAAAAAACGSGGSLGLLRRPPES